MSTQVQAASSNQAEMIIATISKEQAGFREVFKTQKAFDKFKSNFRLMTVKNPDILGDLILPNGEFKTKEGKQSLFMSLFQAAHDGLVIDGKRSALVLFNQNQEDINGKKVKIKTVQYFPMVLGIREKVYEFTGMLLEAQIVYSNDYFEWEQGDNPKLIHKPSLELDDTAKPLAVYAVARKDGQVVDRVVMRIAEINKITRSSKSGFKQEWDKAANRYKTDATGNPVGEVVGIWKDHWEEMAKKTAIRRLAKQLPLVEEVESIIESVDQYYQDTPRKNVTQLNDPSQDNKSRPTSFISATEKTDPEDENRQINKSGISCPITGEYLEPPITHEEAAEAVESGLSVAELRDIPKP